jgi:3-hydroxyacyl-CoA dehydrogenase
LQLFDTKVKSTFGTPCFFGTLKFADFVGVDIETYRIIASRVCRDMQKMREVFLSATVSSESQQRTASPRKGARTERSPDPTILDNLINKWGKLKI